MSRRRTTSTYHDCAQALTHGVLEQVSKGDVLLRQPPVVQERGLFVDD
jgi:hypothetical protein